MGDVLVFKVQSLTEGGFVTFAPDYSQYSETLDLAAKRLQVQVDMQVKALQDELRKGQVAPITGGPPKTGIGTKA